MTGPSSLNIRQSARIPSADSAAAGSPPALPAAESPTASSGGMPGQVERVFIPSPSLSGLALTSAPLPVAAGDATDRPRIGRLHPLAVADAPRPTAAIPSDVERDLAITLRRRVDLHDMRPWKNVRRGC